MIGLLGALLGIAPAQQPRPPAVDSVDRFVIAEMRRQRIPGLALAVVSHGRIIKARGYGFANVELRVPATDSTIFQSGSVGKQFTAAGILLLVEDGKLALDDPITKYLPEGEERWHDVTVRHLLTHTSGIPEYEESDSASVDLRHDYTEDSLVKIAAWLPLEFPPGTHWHYSNTGFMLLGVIIHRVSGTFYGDLLAQRVFQPLGMRTARVISESDIVMNRSAGYQLVDGQLKNQDWVAPSLNTTADGALYLSARDMIAWDRGLTEGRIITPQSRAAMWTPATLAGDGGSVDYGFGWSVTHYRGHRAIGHTGSWQGFKSMIQRFPDDSLTVILLANLAETLQRPIVYGVAAMYRRGLTPPYALRVDSDTATAGRFVGLLRSLGGSPEASSVTEVRGFTTTLLDDSRREFARLADSSRSATWHGCDNLASLHLERHGVEVARSCYVDLVGPDSRSLMTFWLTAEGVVADVSRFDH
ncbi:MAG TPA: serine hydrolase domain-containing protein [Gemmatimonadales bacterium]|nr:serine hydrolase domain-containing protein [Gemmatimonadales bacterium]